ncbi:hypothetical protein DPQ22_08045 [Candidatus Tokpelaia sp.]|nr:hypothetical protein DPQ22_08045 [Candidatus Tokpelaia sp.]
MLPQLISLSAYSRSYGKLLVLKEFFFSYRGKLPPCSIIRLVNPERQLYLGSSRNSAGDESTRRQYKWACFMSSLPFVKNFMVPD